MVIKTPKGMYLRLNDKIIKIKGGMLGLPSKSSNENSPSQTPPRERRNGPDYSRETIDLDGDNDSPPQSNEAIDLVDEHEVETLND